MGLTSKRVPLEMSMRKKRDNKKKRENKLGRRILRILRIKKETNMSIPTKTNFPIIE